MEGMMRGFDEVQDGMFSYVSMEKRIPEDHPLRAIRRLLDPVFRRLDPTFDRLYARSGRPSIPPEQLIRALVLQRLYSIPSERRLIEQLDYNLLFRWFVGLSMDAQVWHPTTFTKNRDRAISEGILDAFFGEVVEEAAAHGLLSRDHFSVDGTLIDACASMKSFRPKDDDDDDPGQASPKGRNQTADFRGQKRRNDTHASTTDPDARLFRKSNGQASRLCYGGHIMTENRNGLIVEATVTHAGTKAERNAALEMLDRRPREHRRTLGADRGYDVAAFHQDLRDRNVTPHIAARRDTTLDARTLRHPGYRISQRLRKRVEEPFGWMKTTGTLRRFMHRGLEKVTGIFKLSAASYNLLRMARLLAPA
jgi:transposase